MRQPCFPPFHSVSRLAALALGLAAAAGPLGAQRLDELAVGARVRVTANTLPHRVVGTVVRADTTGLLLASAHGGDAVYVSTFDLRRVDESRSRRGSGEAFWRGAGVGFLVGAGVSVVATTLAYRYDRRATCDCMIPATVVVGALGVGFTAVSSLTGGAIGLARRERWHRVWPQE